MTADALRPKIELLRTSARDAMKEKKGGLLVSHCG